MSEVRPSDELFKPANALVIDANTCAVITDSGRSVMLYDSNAPAFSIYLDREQAAELRDWLNEVMS